jgi:hypothetical protein
LPESIRQPSGNPPVRNLAEPEPESSGRALATHMQELDREVPRELRLPIVEVLIDILGKRSIAYPPGMPTKTLQERADALLDELHGIAKSLYLTGYKTDADVLALEEFWAKDWRGKNGGGTPQQFWAFVGERQGLAARNGRQPPVAPVMADGPAIPETFPGTEAR